MSTPIKKIPLTHIEDIPTGDYIPLTGTEEGKPVTGDVEFGNLDGETKLLQGENADGKKSGLSLGSTLDYEGAGIVTNLFVDGENTQSIIGFNGAVPSIKLIDKVSEHTTNVLFGLQYISISNVDPLFIGLEGTYYYGANYNDNTYIQKLYADKQHSYSTDEIKTGGTWIDGKDIYTITQLTAETPPTMETAFPTEVIGTYTVYKYTKP